MQYYARSHDLISDFTSHYAYLLKPNILNHEEIILGINIKDDIVQCITMSPEIVEIPIKVINSLYLNIHRLLGNEHLLFNNLLMNISKNFPDIELHPS